MDAQRLSPAREARISTDARRREDSLARATQREALQDAVDQEEERPEPERDAGQVRLPVDRARGRDRRHGGKELDGLPLAVGGASDRPDRVAAAGERAAVLDRDAELP